MKTVKRQLVTLPNARLRQRSKKVGLVSGEIKRLAEDMQAVTLDWEDHRQHEVGVALAAVQVDALLRLIVIRNNFDNKQDRSFNVFINPEITKYEGSVSEDFEGCLSVADIYGKVRRHSSVRVKAMGLDGRSIRVKAEGFLARVFQHEIDHTNGIVFIDHIKDRPEAFFKLLPDGKLEPLDYKKDVTTNSILW